MAAPDQFEVLSRRPDISFRLRDLPPASPLYIGPDEQLSSSIWSSLAGIAIIFSGRVLLPDGRISPFSFRYVTDATRTPIAFRFSIPEGYLLGLVASTENANVRRGQIFVETHLRSTATALGVRYTSLWHAYIDGTGHLGWPPGEVESSFSGRGNNRVIIGTGPAAGVQISETVPANAMWRLVSVRLRLITDATVATRAVLLLIDDPLGTTIFESDVITTQAASLARVYMYSPVTPVAIMASNRITGHIPQELYLFEGCKFLTVVNNFQVGDIWNAPQFMVEEWLVE